MSNPLRKRYIPDQRPCPAKECSNGTKPGPLSGIEMQCTECHGTGWVTSERYREIMDERIERAIREDTPNHQAEE